MHDMAIWLLSFAALFREAKETDVFAQAREIFLPLPLVLNPKQIHDVRRLKNFIELMAHGHAELFKFPRYQSAWTDERDPRAKLQERENIRARDATEKNVPNNHNMQSRDRAFTRADRVKIEQGLGRMLVRAIARVDDARLEALREKLGRARRAMPNDNQVGVICFENLRGVLERL